MRNQDIHSSNMVDYELFQQVFKDGLYEEALEILNEAQFDNKRIDAKAINDSIFKLKYNQRNFYGHVDDVLDNYLERLSVGLKNFKFIGVFSPTENYEANNVVEYNGDYYYLSLGYSGPDKIAPPNYPWIKLGAKGKDGVPGMSNLHYAGIFSLGKKYEKIPGRIDFVYGPNDSFYWVKKTNAGQVINNPTYWGVLIKGEKQDMVVSSSDADLKPDDIWLQIV